LICSSTHHFQTSGFAGRQICKRTPSLHCVGEEVQSQSCIIQHLTLVSPLFIWSSVMKSPQQARAVILASYLVTKHSHSRECLPPISTSVPARRSMPNGEFLAFPLFHHFRLLLEARRPKILQPRNNDLPRARNPIVAPATTPMMPVLASHSHCVSAIRDLRLVFHDSGIGKGLSIVLANSTSTESYLVVGEIT